MTAPPDTDHDTSFDIERFERAFARRLLTTHRGAPRLPGRQAVARLVDELLGLLFPQLAAGAEPSADALHRRLVEIRYDLARLLEGLVPEAEAPEIAARFTASLPEVHGLLRLDASAILDGDPAAESLDEVIAAYPGFHAIGVHRLAHTLHGLGVPILPRLLAEVAHSRTGVDIHPGARIGRRFCIDHGTGVVIGETAVLGERVKVYQGVTLGALSVAKSAAGTKRHPTIEDRVVLYANATVLGGNTIVGHDSVIGGSAWIVTSLPPHSFVYHASEVRIRRASDLAAGDYVI